MCQIVQFRKVQMNNDSWIRIHSGHSDNRSRNLHGQTRTRHYCSADCTSYYLAQAWTKEILKLNPDSKLNSHSFKQWQSTTNLKFNYRAETSGRNEHSYIAGCNCSCPIHLIICPNRNYCSSLCITTNHVFKIKLRKLKSEFYLWYFATDSEMNKIKILKFRKCINDRRRQKTYTP